jgi:enterochelin esterase-like enzyme
MITRQAISEARRGAAVRTKRLVTLLMLLVGFYACTPLNQPVPTLTPFSPTASQTTQPSVTPSPTPTSTIIPLACLTNPGHVEEGSLDSTNPPQEFRIYFPPCYVEKTDQRYPVLYLLHGQTFTDDQWIRLGAVKTTDRMILSGESIPFIIVFPDDRYWNLPPGPGFGQRLVDEVIPYVDATYRTLPDRNHRAIGGMSRGAGWALRLGLIRWDLFGTIGLHSLAVQSDVSEIRGWLGKIPPTSRPRVFMDIGDNDQELENAQLVETQFNDFGLMHEWHLYSGAHTEEYWSAHVEEYVRWYAEGWNNP